VQKVQATRANTVIDRSLTHMQIVNRPFNRIYKMLTKWLNIN